MKEVKPKIESREEVIEFPDISDRLNAFFNFRDKHKKLPYIFFDIWYNIKKFIEKNSYNESTVLVISDSQKNFDNAMLRGEFIDIIRKLNLCDKGQIKCVTRFEQVLGLNFNKCEIAMLSTILHSDIRTINDIYCSIYDSRLKNNWSKIFESILSNKNKLNYNAM